MTMLSSLSTALCALNEVVTRRIQSRDFGSIQRRGSSIVIDVTGMGL